MSPIAICALLEYHFLADPITEGEYTTNTAAVRQLVMHGCIDSMHGDAYELTERGKAMVEFLHRMPLPVQTWVQP